MYIYSRTSHGCKCAKKLDCTANLKEFDLGDLCRCKTAFHYLLVALLDRFVDILAIPKLPKHDLLYSETGPKKAEIFFNIRDESLYSILFDSISINHAAASFFKL